MEVMDYSDMVSDVQMDLIFQAVECDNMDNSLQSESSEFWLGVRVPN